TAETPREMFRETAHLMFRETEHLGDIREGASCLERRKTAHDGAMLAAKLVEDEIHDVVFAVVCEINVDVGKFVERHSFLVEEAAEVQAEADRTHVRNLQAVTDQRICSAAACDPFNVTLAAGLQQLPGDEKIILV